MIKQKEAEREAERQEKLKIKEE